jgi:hypothetical protein
MVSLLENASNSFYIESDKTDKKPKAGMAKNKEIVLFLPHFPNSTTVTP